MDLRKPLRLSTAMDGTTRGPRSAAKRRGGFTLIELIIAVTVLAILAGAAVPVTAKVLDYKARTATQEEQQGIVAAAADYFADTQQLPSSIADLLVQPVGLTAWTGPYLPGVSTDSLSGLTTFQVDGWSRPYRVTVTGDVWTLESAGADNTFSNLDDITTVLNVTYLRRRESLRRLEIVNQAIQQYNGTWMGTDPLSTDWPTAFQQLVTRGFLPNDASLRVDGWGTDWEEDPAGISPVVQVRSTHL